MEIVSLIDPTPLAHSKGGNKKSRIVSNSALQKLNEFCYEFNASAPPTISKISFVIAA